MQQNPILGMAPSPTLPDFKFEVQQNSSFAPPLKLAPTAAQHDDEDRRGIARWLERGTVWQQPFQA